jgi:hypothetical protein
LCEPNQTQVTIWGSSGFHPVGSKDWANSKLKFGIKLLNDGSTWSESQNRKFKVIVVRNIVFWLGHYGFWWQSERLRNHLHCYFRSLKVVYAQERETSERERERGSF